MTKPNFSNALTAQDRQTKALADAQAILKAKGVLFPINDHRLTPEENYSRLMAYSQQEAALVVSLLREPSGPRPLVVDNVKPKSKGWDGYSD